MFVIKKGGKVSRPSFVLLWITYKNFVSLVATVGQIAYNNELKNYQYQEIMYYDTCGC